PAVGGVEGERRAAERVLGEAASRAEQHGRPQPLAEEPRDLAVVLRRAGRSAEAQAAARRAKATFARLGAESEIRHLAGQGWEPDFAAELRGSLAPLHAAHELADAGRYGELLTYLTARSQEELEKSPMLTLLCGIAHSRLGRLDLGQQWPMVPHIRERTLRHRPPAARELNV